MTKGRILNRTYEFNENDLGVQCIILYIYAYNNTYIYSITDVH